MAKPDIFSGPIPGQSLTAEPGNYPWEQPPKYANPLDALDYYLKRFTNQEVLDDLVDMLEMGIPVATFTEIALKRGFMEGLHTVDVKMLLKPMLMMHIKGLADAAGVEYKLSMDDYAGEDTEEARRKLSAKLAAKFKTDLKGKTPDAGTQLQEEVTESLEQDEMQEQEEAAPVMEEEQETMEPMQEADVPPQGLMARG